MELLEGEPLASRLETGPLPLSDAGTIVLSMLAALEALHHRQIVHRDLKPTNVFLTPHGVKLLVARLVAQRPDGPAQLLELAGGEVVKRNVGGNHSRLADGILEPIEQAEVALAPERLEHRRTCLGPLRGEAPEESLEGAPLRRVEGGGLAPEVRDQHVEVADRSEYAPEPAELGAERRDPFRVEHGPGGAEQRPESTVRHAHLVELFGIGSMPRARVVGEKRRDLALEHRLEMVDGERRR